MISRLTAAIALAATLGTAQAAPLTYALDVSHGGLSGPGAAVLQGAAANAQFILFGEDHGFADSPILVRALAHDVRPLGFKRLVVEVGARSTAMVAEALRRDGVPGVAKIVHDVPLGLPFLSLKEDDELVSDFLGHDARGTPYLWGVDQEFIGSPIFHLARLAAIAPNDAARAEAQRLLAAEQDAAAKAAQDKFLLTVATPAQFDALATLFQGEAEAQGIIADLKESADIYQAWMHGHNYDNNAHRARFLAARFLADYHAADEPAPKVIFKMGIEHVALGTTTINTVDLGTLATMMARANGKTALRIAFLPAGGHNLGFAPKPGNPTAVSAYDPKEWGDIFKVAGLDLATLSKTSWTLIPLEPIRQALDTNGIAKLKPESRFLLLGFDYLITTPDAKPATFLY
ncbi:MAG TPA: hypothetical protein VNU97_16665 [Rhizomicrobium sp.]|jgi:hypothetical protein|nr:hypothetical protein [Rhizomicrobium sp.]